MNHALLFTSSMMIAAGCPVAGGFACPQAVESATVARATSTSAKYKLVQSSRVLEKRREMERRQREMKEKIERDRKEMERRRRQMQLRVERHRGEVQRMQQQIASGGSLRSRHAEPPPFDPSTAADPKTCFEIFIKKVRNADSVEDFISYLPLSDQRYLKQEQAKYDPNEVPAKRARFIKMKPDISESTLDYLTQSPYEHKFKHYTEIAKKFRYVKSVEIKENTAKLQVATFSRATKNGVEYNYSSAEVELVGEASFWRMTGYEDSSVHYRYPQD